MVDSGHRLSRQEDRVEQRHSVASFTSREEERLSKADAVMEKYEGDRLQRLRWNDARGCGAAESALSCVVKFTKKWSEICRGVIMRQSVPQLWVNTRSRSGTVVWVGRVQTNFKSREFTRDKKPADLGQFNWAIAQGNCSEENILSLP